MGLSTLVRKDNTFRVEAILLPASAWDATPLEVGVSGAEDLLLFCAYNRGGVGGAVDLVVEASPYSVDHPTLQTWHHITVTQVGAFAAGADVLEAVQRQGQTTYTSTAAAREGFILGAYGLVGSVERVRVTCRESGAAGTPGTVGIVGVMA